MKKDFSTLSESDWRLIFKICHALDVRDLKKFWAGTIKLRSCRDVPKFLKRFDAVQERAAKASLQLP